MFNRELFYDLDKILVSDIEANALHDPDTVHCAVFSDLDGNTTEIIRPDPENAAGAELSRVYSEDKTHTGHHFLSYDAPVIRGVFPDTDLPDNNILDTLVLSRLINFDIKGGHSLDAWGKRMNMHKKFSDMSDFSVYSDELLERCYSDVAINVALVKKFLRFLEDKTWHPSILIEHNVASMCQVMTKNGLPFDTARAEKIHKEITDKLLPMDEALQRDFKPRVIRGKEIHPRVTKAGTLSRQDFRWFDGVDYLGIGRDDLSVFTGGPFTRVETMPFNPASPRQIVERLNEAGWKPTEKTKGHIHALRNKRKTSKDKLAEYATFGWKVSETNLRTLSDDAPASAHILAQRLIMASRLSDLSQWLRLQRQGYIHGQYQPIGAWTHRLAHHKPNNANVPVARREDDDTEFDTYINDINDSFRELFIAPKGQRLIGTDADGIQMRIFCHLIEDPALLKAILEGKKEDGTDIHSLHKTYLGDVCAARHNSKTFIYAWLLGSGTGKVAEILECSMSEAKAAVEKFIGNYPGLGKLKKETIPRDAARGYLIGLDGRKLIVPEERLVLAGYLQNGEKVIMARALRQWYNRLTKEKVPFQLVNWVHDEWQTLTVDDDDTVKYIQEVQIQSFRDQGRDLGLYCPLDGESKQGYSWRETH